MKKVKYFFLLFFTGCLQFMNGQDFPRIDSYHRNDELSVYLIYTLALCPGSCDGQVATVVDGGQPPYYYSWSNGATTPEIYDLCPGAGEVTVTDNSGNTATEMYAIEIFPVPTAIIDTLFITQPTGGLNNGNIAVDSTYPPFFVIDSVWSIDSINFIPYHIFRHLGPGVYHLYLRTWEGCIFRATGDIILYDITGVEDVKFSFSLYPNPVTTDLQLNTEIPLSVEIMDLNGKLVFKESAKREHAIQMSSLPDGMYVVRISDGDKFSFKKIIKSN